MIRISPFDKLTYNELRDAYLKRIVDIGVVAFDGEDILDKKYSRDKVLSKTYITWEKLRRNGDEYGRLKEFLFPNDIIDRNNLRRLLAGPEIAPASLGGNGPDESLRQYFEDIIIQVGVIEEPHEDDKLNGCGKIFKYDTFSDNKGHFGESTAYWLQRQLGVKVCPYCNRMYTTSLHGKYKIRPDFDHFYPKSKYPYLAVSLFNLIPSCSACNRKKSDNIDNSIIYPYEESFDESQKHVSFRIIAGEKEVMQGKSDKFAIELQPNKYEGTKKEYFGGVLAQTDLDTRFNDISEEDQFWKRAKASIDLLLIEKLYNEHKDEIMSILRNHYQYNQDSIELILKTLLRKKYPKATEREIKLYTWNMLYFAFLQQEEWGKSPLNKLKHDILEQLDEIEET